jgi:HNH endonuclease
MKKFKPKQLPSLDRVLELLDYDPVSGVFRWRESRGRVRAGAVAGCVFKNRCDGLTYLAITIDRQLCCAHRLAFLIMTGECPDLVDHEDRDGLNNRWKNLRDGTLGNVYNTRKPKHNASGYKNVHWHTVRKRWIVQVKAHGVFRDKRFTVLAEAVAYADKVRKELHGEFSRAA